MRLDSSNALSWSTTGSATRKTKLGISAGSWAPLPLTSSPRITFYAHFTDKRDAVLGALEMSGAQVMALAVPAARRAGDWQQGVRALYEAICAYFIAEPAMAELATVGVYGAGPRALARRDRVIDSLVAMLAPGFEENPSAPAVSAEAIGATVYALMREQVLKGGPESLGAVVPLATYISLVTFVGPERALAIANGEGTLVGISSVTVSSGVADSAGDGLDQVHGRLQTHFSDLRDQRAGVGAPLFALEHGLTPPELAQICEQVVPAIRAGRVPDDAWLPVVVYASEFGYAYSGDEYWQTFEARTPGWAERGDRSHIRQKFEVFNEQFNGAEPTGPWARHFSIICWPITHAVLPADLQRHLARLLFEYRRGLTSELLRDPDELGRHLAARAWQTSSRFQYFAQNTGLLGRVAAALLVGEDQESPFLLRSTLKRILSDLSHERSARQWLHGARTSAARLRRRGFLPADSSFRDHGGEHVTLPPAADPIVSMQRLSGDWTAFMEIPDLSILASRFPEISRELDRRRAVLAGVGGAPVASGRLLYPGQRFRLDEWPPVDEQLVQVEDAEPVVNEVLADQCVLSPGPCWLFGVRAPGYAKEVRSKRVRPGRDYVMVSEEALNADVPAWISPVSVGTDRLEAYELRVPPVLEDEHLDALREIGISALADLEIRPAGLVPASWDGEGSAEWLDGERPVLALSSTRVVTKSVWAIDGQLGVIEWPSATKEIFIELKDLGVGAHELVVSLFGADDQLIGEGSMELRIRPPQPRTEVGTNREGLMILATPVNPTLTELWDGEAAVEVRGPVGVEAALQLALSDRARSTLALVEARVHLPVSAEDWAGLFERLLRKEASVHKAYDEVESCEIRVSHPGLGCVALQCERPFAALRWAGGRDGKGPYLRLVNHTESVGVDIELFDFESPDRSSKIQVDDASRLRSTSGGLAIAAADSATTAMILPPTVHHFDDLPGPPRLGLGKKSVGGVLAVVELAGKWGDASRSSDPFGEVGRINVLRGIAGHIAGLIGGPQWTTLESRNRERGDVGETTFLGAVGSKPNQRALSRDVARWTDGLIKVSPEERAESLATSLAAHARLPKFRSEDPRFAEFLLRLASAPESLTSWPRDEQEAHLGRVLQAPFLIRAARCLVLAVHARAQEGRSATFEGWAWK